MAVGNNVILQIGKESTYATTVTATEQIAISSESLKETYNKIDEGLAVGGRGSGKVATMGIGVEGSFATLMRPDMGTILKCALGVEDVDDATEGYKHSFTAIGTGESDKLPSMTVNVDRKVSKFAYAGCKINTLTLSAEAGNYLTCEVAILGKNEASLSNLASLTPSSKRAFKFAQGKAYIDGTEIADVKSMSLELNNNLDSQVQTTSTGDYYKEPQCGTREITSSLSMIYSASAETIRQNFYKSDSTFALKLEFISDEKITSTEPYKLTIILPCCQMSDATANMGGLNDTLPQDCSIKVVDNLTDELITIELTNDESDEY